MEVTWRYRIFIFFSIFFFSVFSTTRSLVFVKKRSERFNYVVRVNKFLPKIEAGACFRRPKFTGFCEAFLEGK